MKMESEIVKILMIELTTLSSMIWQPKHNESDGVCFEEIGCFSCDPPFTDYVYRPLCLLPERNTPIYYLLFTPQNRNESYNVTLTKSSIAASPFDASLPTKIIIPGYDTSLDMYPTFLEIKDELLKRRPYNVIVVDWYIPSKPPYFQAVANGRKVGALIALLLKKIKEYKNIDYNSIHIIAHSLGGHVAGWAGERLNKIARITGLDPAGPYFQHAPPIVRLDKTDAVFVDVVHTNGGDLYIEGEALYQSIGHVDFYVNGGNQQPVCGQRNVSNARSVESCDHQSSFKYFKYSINVCRFPAVLCDNYENTQNGQCTCDNSVINYMGFHAKKKPYKGKTLNFYLNTTASPPFCNEHNKCPVSKNLNVKDGPLLQLFLLFASQLYYAARNTLQILNFLHLM